jgi:hypothetical protein
MFKVKFEKMADTIFQNHFLKPFSQTFFQWIKGGVEKAHPVLPWEIWKICWAEILSWIIPHV